MQNRAWHALGIGPVLISRSVVSMSPVARTVADGPERPDEQTIQPEPAQSQPPEFIAGEADWPALERAVADCRLCGLCESRQRPVFGIGQRNPRWLIVGEAPGEQEDQAGEPFVGPAGHLLDAMLHAVGANRVDDVFIVNVLKCRPPRNRDPLPDEVAKCRPYLEQQIRLLKPELILTIGRFAAQTLLQTEVSVGQLRGRVHEIEIGGRRIPTVVSYHPAYLLRRPEEKAKAWQDLCLARSVIEPVKPPA